jgi:hypothetical protein
VVNQEKLSHIANNPSEITAEDARELEQLTRNFPYFSLPYALLTRYYAVHHDYRYEDTLHKTALRVNDRAWLYDFVHDHTSEPTNGQTEVHQNIPAEAEPIEETAMEETVFEEIRALETPLADEAAFDTSAEAAEAVVPEIDETPTEPAGTVDLDELPVLEEITPEPLDAVAPVTEPVAETTTTSEETASEEPSGSVRFFEPDGLATEVGMEPMSEDAVFEEIELFDSKTALVPELMAEDENTLELMAELDLSGPMVFPDTGVDEEPELAETSTPVVPTAQRLPLAGSVYSIEDYYPTEKDEHKGPPSDFFSWLNNPEYTGNEIEPPIAPVEDKKHLLIDKFISNPTGISRPKADFFNATDVARKSEAFPDDIVTETLAGVYLKQENYSGAIRIYEKLVLKFPEKSAYFAALIEKIKKEHL